MIWLAQCLCPSRHAILGAAGSAVDERSAEAITGQLRESVEVALKAGWINPWCGLCHAKSDTWIYELGRTRFATMAEATPELQRLQDKQAVTRTVFGDMKRSD